MQRTRAVLSLHHTKLAQKRSGASSAPARPSARHSRHMVSGCSVVQDGASSACLNRLSLVACDQLSPPSLSSALPVSSCGARLQTVRSIMACFQRSRVWGACLITWTAHACRTCTGRPVLKYGLQALPTERSGGQQSASAHTSAGSSSRRTALGRAATLAVDERVFMLRCGVCCSRGCSRRLVAVTRLDQHATVGFPLQRLLRGQWCAAWVGARQAARGRAPLSGPTCEECTATMKLFSRWRRKQCHSHLLQALWSLELS